MKSKFDSEWRRFSIQFQDNKPPSHEDFRTLVEGLHSLHSIPFTVCYTSHSGDLLPITNDDVSYCSSGNMRGWNKRKIVLI